MFRISALSLTATIIFLSGCAATSSMFHAQNQALSQDMKLEAAAAQSQHASSITPAHFASSDTHAINKNRIERSFSQLYYSVDDQKYVLQLTIGNTSDAMPPTENKVSRFPNFVKQVDTDHDLFESLE